MSNYSDSKFHHDPNTPWFKTFMLIPPKSSVLDIGCSSGNFGKELIDNKKCIVDGVEPYEKDAKLAKQKLRQVFDFNIENEAPSKLLGRYDIINYGDVIEHLINPVEALKNTKKLLKKDGKVIFSIPNMAHISVRLMLLKGNFEYGEAGLLDKTHLHYYDIDEIIRIFNEAGFVIEKLDWVSRDLPVEIIKIELEKMGLISTDKFLDEMKKPVASAYQYIGQAGQSNSHNNPEKLTKVSPRIDLFEKRLLEIRKSYEEEFNNKTVQATQSEIEKVKKYYENSTSWKATSPLRRLTNLFKRPLRKK